MDLTKEKAIQLSYALWIWMKEHKEIDKGKWPGWSKHGSMKHHCPCCQYVNVAANMDRWSCMDSSDCIDSCPLLGIWPAKRPSDIIPCCRKASPFKGFEDDADDAKALKIVDKMVTAIKDEMKLLKIKPLDKEAP